MSIPAPKHLPVPPLRQTVEGLLRATAAVADADVLRGTEQAARSFLEGPGPELQQGLQDFAAREDAAGRSWLSEHWLTGYLTVREPLPLSTNVSFQLNSEFLSHTAPGPRRAAEFLHRAASVHLAQARRTTPPEVDARGNAMTMDQWECFNGGVRDPQPDADQILRCTLDGAAREVGIFHRGRLFLLTVSDDAGNPLSVPDLEAGLTAILETADDAPVADASVQGSTEATAPDSPMTETHPSRERAATGPLPFAAASYLGSGELARLREALFQGPEDAQTYATLRDLLFTVTVEEHAASDTEHLRALAFQPSRVWAYKPMSYEISLADDWLCVHVEHSTVDGATLVTAVRRMQEVRIVPQDAERTPVPASPRELVWHWDEQAARTVRAGVERVTDRARQEVVALRQVARTPASDLPLRVSADAAQQLVLGLAQYLAYGTVRSVYEAVDMREYQAGRTECLRPMTPEAVELIHALAAESATREQLDAALEAHRVWVKACKAGHGLDRHLLGLQFVAQERGVEDVALFTDDGVQAVFQNFLSTTSVGGPDQILRYAFAPAVRGGLGISYTPRADSFEFCVVHRREDAADAERFLDALGQASGMLWEFVSRLD